MPDTGAPWNLPYVSSSELVADWPTDNQSQMEAIADALPRGIGPNIVQTVETGTFSTSSSSYVDVLTASITPTTNTAKILVMAMVPVSYSDSNTVRSGKVSLFRGAVNLSSPDTPGSRTVAMGGINVYTIDSAVTTVTPVFLDSPASSSSVTYSAAVTMGGSSGTMYVNRGVDDTDTASRLRTVTTLTLIEVAA